LGHFHLVSARESEILKEVVIVLSLGFINKLFPLILDSQLLLSQSAWIFKCSFTYRDCSTLTSLGRLLLLSTLSTSSGTAGDLLEANI
jgi:hypothetical protein